MASALATIIRNNVAILDVVQEYVQLVQNGAEFKGLSPFKQEKTPSFFVSPSKNVYYCFSTKKGGDVISFIMEVEKLEYKEALRFLAKKYNIHVSEEDKAEYEAYTECLALYKRLASTLHYLLYNHPESEYARSYLQTRGINESSVKQFQIGYAPRDPNWLIQFLLKKGYSQSFLRKLGLLTRYNSAFFRNRIMFPLVNQQNEYLGFGARLLGERGPKYLHSPESMVFTKKRFFYGLDRAKEAVKASNKIYLVEGYFDVIACHQAGIKNVAAPLGTSLSQEALQILLPYTDTIVLLFDADEAGMRAAIRVANLAMETELILRGVLIPEGADPAEMLQVSGAAAFKEVLEQEEDIFELILAYNLKKHNNTLGELYSNIFPFIKQIQAETKKTEYLKKLASAIQSKQESVEYDYNQFLYNKRIGVRVKKDAPIEKARISKELIIASTNWHYFARLREEVTAEDYITDNDKRLFYILEDVFRGIDENKGDFPRLVQKEIADVYIKEQMFSSIFNPPNFDIGMKTIEAAVQNFTRKRYEKKRKKLIETYTKVHAENLGETAQDIAEEIVMMDKKIDTLRYNK